MYSILCRWQSIQKTYFPEKEKYFTTKLKTIIFAIFVFQSKKEGKKERKLPVLI